MVATLYHLNCVRIETPIQANVCGHCLLINEAGRLILIDTGIGLLDTQDPEGRIGKDLINMVGYQLDESITAIKQIVKLGLDPAMVTDCIITHLDNDHTGGLADFPLATVHIGAEEMANYESGNLRYLKMPLAHLPKIKTYNTNDTEWFGLQARKIAIGTETEIFLVPLFGHTLGHCGIALRVSDRWLFYIGDAYYLRIELTDNEHPVNQLAQMRADDNEMRLESLEKIRKLKATHPEIDLYGYHDIDEFDYFEKQ